jgi:hypothetical protein
MSLIRQSAFLFADRLVFAASIFMTGVLIARCYGTEGFGLYVVASAVLQTLVGTIASATEVPFSRSWLSVREPAEKSRVQSDFVRALACWRRSVWQLLAGFWPSRIGLPR